MDFFSVLKLVGGLSLFLFGMITLGGGLEKMSGGKFEKTLERLTDTPIKGVLFGAAVTAAIQSSSATTVMIVGFVNAGIMRLSQSVGIIMGSNIGTTVTSWILSLTGLKSSNPFVMMLQPKNFSLVFAVIGIILLIASKSESRNNVGRILLGFTVLIFGMDMMSGAVSPLKNNPQFAELLVFFENPILGVLLGAIVTAIIQSSSASVGMLQALSATGAIHFSSAIPIILGQNIGTCVTAMLSCIGTNKSAKRVALVHLYFNIIGTIIFLSLIYVLKTFINFSFWNNSIDAFGIAIVHTIFNVFCTILFLPFTKFLEKLACMTIKDKDDASETTVTIGQMLDDRFLNSPGYALEQCKATILKMAEIIRTNLSQACDALWDFDNKVMETLIANEHIVDSLDDKISGYLIKLTDKNLNFNESKLVSKFLKSVSDFERIGDHAEAIMKHAAEKNKNGIILSSEAKGEIENMAKAVLEILDIAISVFDSDDVAVAHKVEPLEEIIDVMRNRYKALHVERVKKGTCNIEIGFVFLELILNLERISDHCSNLAVYVIEYKCDDKDYHAHEYLRNLRENASDVEYDKALLAFSKKYLIK